MIQTHTLPNGLRLVHLYCDSPVSYGGFAINAGARDETPDGFGMAHFVEHLLFKGTQKRKSWHILNRMEVVGGELNAYTTKEETFVYSIFLESDFERAFELLSDLVFHSTFPEKEVEKEVEVIREEIHSYEDNPSELIYDEFENLLFEGQDLGHHILGTPESLTSFSSAAGLAFVAKHYRPANMVFFSMGRTDFKKIVRWAERFTGDQNGGDYTSQRKVPEIIPAKKLREQKDTSQAHVMIGGRAYGLHDERRVGLYLLNNILGGPGMNSRLNISLREKMGWVYQVDSSLTSYSDTGVFSLYFGSEKRHAEKCIKLIDKEFRNLRENKLNTSQLAAAKKQLIGQLGIANEHRENTFLSLGKSMLHYDRYDSLKEVCRQIEELSTEGLWDIANEVLDERGMFSLVYE